MEDSLGSSMKKAVASQGTGDPPEEESGWTAYFEDFSNNNNIREPSSGFDSPSLVSDASSGAAWKISNKKHVVACSSPIGGSPEINPKKLNFKKTRTKEISHDDSLEDTASSPVNSPKVSDMNTRKTDDNINNYLGKEGTSEEHYSEMHTDHERSEMDLNGKNSNCTDIKKKGLCLVPFSMLVNYLG